MARNISLPAGPPPFKTATGDVVQYPGRLRVESLAANGVRFELTDSVLPYTNPLVAANEVVGKGRLGGS